ncbi:MAG: hypothetical protein ABJ084_05015 [Halioglobus sp.]
MSAKYYLWWATTVILACGWGYLAYALMKGAGEDFTFWLLILATAIVTTSHWLNRIGTDSELEELILQSKKAEVRAQIIKTQSGR